MVRETKQEVPLIPSSLHNTMLMFISYITDISYAQHKIMRLKFDRHCIAILTVVIASFGCIDGPPCLVAGFTQNLLRPAIVPVPRYSSSPRLLSSSMSSDFDFPSAMPAKPELTLEEKMAQSADGFINNMKIALKANDVPYPPELDALIKVREDPASSVSDITLRVYRLMIERGMLYDEDPETGSLTPTTFDDIPNNLDVPEVKQEFLHLYKYGMMLLDKGLLDGEQVKETVIERLVKRTGLTPEKFDEWLGF
jgi:hypothetical protein